MTAQAPALGRPDHPDHPPPVSLAAAPSLRLHSSPGSAAPVALKPNCPVRVAPPAPGSDTFKTHYTDTPLPPHCSPLLQRWPSQSDDFVPRFRYPTAHTPLGAAPACPIRWQRPETRSCETQWHYRPTALKAAPSRRRLTSSAMTYTAPSHRTWRQIASLDGPQSTMVR